MNVSEMELCNQFGDLDLYLSDLFKFMEPPWWTNATDIEKSINKYAVYIPNLLYLEMKGFNSF